MSRHGKELRRLVREFLEEKESFWGFHEAFLDRWTRLPDGVLSLTDHTAWSEIYGWILTSIPDPVSSEDGDRGLIGEAALRTRLRGHPLLAPPQ
jgi:hypothetical protein